MNEESLFQEALSRSAEERAAFLDQACAGQPDFRAAVEALLAAHEKPGNVLDRPPTKSVETLPPSPGQAHPDVTVDRTQGLDDAPSAASVTTDYHPMAEAGIVIGRRYTLQEKIGEGGMGEVWVARQTEPIKRRVALKLIKTGMDSRSVLQRFEQERQALAMMDHPNIARVLDGGLTPTGQPFFVMELVNGLSLNKFCDEARLTPRERLELFVPICQAVQHAHQKGIVHRDLKPANILVTIVDGKPIPKVIDFGVAKATAGKLTDESMSTQFGSVIGTLEYMSPEQAGYSGVDIDTRADIYSLGVILYELLTGLRPIDARRLEKAALTEMIRIIREEEPSKPSTRLSTDEALPSLAALRQTEPRRLMSLLRGELDWVVMKCLEKRRERRYETANGLARDIERYLADEPVEARPPSAGYRLGKFLKRHKAPAIAASLVLLALLVGIAGTTYGLVRAEAQRRKAVAAERAEAEQRARAEAERDKAVAAERQIGIERDKAVLAESKSRAINEFLTQDLLTQAEPANNAADDQVTLLEVLDRAADKVGTRFADQPELESALRETIADTYHGLASWEKAEAQWRVKLNLERKRDPESAGTYGAQSELAHILFHRGRYDAEVIKMAETAFHGLERTLGADHKTTLHVIGNLALLQEWAGNLPEAIALFERARDGEIARLGPDNRETLSTLNNLAEAYRVGGRVLEAIALFERVRSGQIATLGADHPNTLTTLSNLAGAYRAAGKIPEAIALYERVRDAEIARLGPDHPNTLTSLAGLAGAYQDAGKLPEAIVMLERVRDARIAKLGPVHPDTLSTLVNLAGGYMAAGRFSEAIALYERARDGRIARLGPDHAETLHTLDELAAAYWRAQQLDKSVPLLEDMLKRREATLGRQHPTTQLTVANLGVNYQDSVRLKEAIPLLEEAYRAIGEFPNRRWIGVALVDAYAKAGRSPEAIALAERVRATLIAGLGPYDPDTLRTLLNLAMFYRGAGKLAEAIELFELVRDRWIVGLGPDHADTLYTLDGLGEVYWEAKRLDKSVPLFEDLLRRQEAKLGRQHRETQKTVANLGVNYKDSGRLNEAIPLLEEAYRAIGKTPSSRWIGSQLSDAYAKAGRRAEAIVLLEQIRDANIADLGPDHPDTLGWLHELGVAYWLAKRLDKSVPLFEDVLKRQEAKLGRRHPNTLLTVGDLGVNYKGSGRLDEAIPLLEEAYRASGKFPNLRQFGAPLVDAYSKAGRSAEAAKLVQELLADARKNAPKDSPQLAGTLAQLGLTLLQINASADAEPIVRECLAIREKTQPDLWNTFTAKSMLGGALLGQKKYAEAEPLLVAGYQGMKRRETTIPPQARDRLTEALVRLIQLYEATARPDEAARWRKELEARK
jgi:eukaryotic-like serine/threonine-protein kinase